LEATVAVVSPPRAPRRKPTKHRDEAYLRTDMKSTSGRRTNLKKLGGAKKRLYKKKSLA
jgi:hypothetical protein